MSNPEASGEQPERAAFAELEDAVDTVLERLADVTARAEESEASSAEFEELVKRFTGDEGEAGRLLSRLKHLEEENEDLHSRLQSGREGIDKVLAKIRYLEERR